MYELQLRLLVHQRIAGFVTVVEMQIRLMLFFPLIVHHGRSDDDASPSPVRLGDHRLAVVADPRELKHICLTSDVARSFEKLQDLPHDHQFKLTYTIPSTQHNNNGRLRHNFLGVQLAAWTLQKAG